MIYLNIQGNYINFKPIVAMYFLRIKWILSFGWNGMRILYSSDLLAIWHWNQIGWIETPDSSALVAIRFYDQIDVTCKYNKNSRW